MYVGRRVINGQFELQKKLGSGGYGTVWKAKNLLAPLDAPQSEKRVAIKFFERSTRGIDEYHNELEAYKVLSATPLCDPYIVCMFKNGNDIAVGPYIVQELMSGDLKDFTGWPHEEGAFGGPVKPEKFVQYRIRNPLSMLLLPGAPAPRSVF